MPALFSRFGRPAAVGLGLAVALALPPGIAAQTAAAPEPDARIAGIWQLNQELSQPWGPKIDAAAGPGQAAGSSKGRETLAPRGGGEAETNRLRLRQRLLAAAEAIQEIEIELEPGVLKVITLDDGVRIFYLTRKHVRQSDDGVKIEVQSVVEGESITLVEKGSDGSSFRETYTYDAAADQLALVVVVEHGRFLQPFVVRTVFDRAS